MVRRAFEWGSARVREPNPELVEGLGGRGHPGGGSRRGNPQFSFENLDVYQRALAFSKKILTITKEIKGQYSWCDQLNRAATSITLNLAEGAGRWHTRDKVNFYFISRGSAFECVPLIELGFELGLIAEIQKAELRDDLQAGCQMLTKLIQSMKKD